MSFDGLGCRAYAAEITPMEPTSLYTGGSVGPQPTFFIKLLNDFDTEDRSGSTPSDPVCSAFQNSVPNGLCRRY
jgi:hypothetical protein